MLINEIKGEIVNCLVCGKTICFKDESNEVWLDIPLCDKHIKENKDGN